MGIIDDVREWFKGLPSINQPIVDGQAYRTDLKDVHFTQAEQDSYVEGTGLAAASQYTIRDGKAYDEYGNRVPIGKVVL